jgi:hypothetical protein
MRFIAAGALLFLATSAQAADGGPIIAYPPQNDTVTMALTVEDWVQTQTARTEVAVDAALPGSDAGKVRADVLNAVKTLAQGAEWRFTSFDHDQDSSGLEHWHAVLEAHLPESQLGGLSDRAKQASKPGTQISVQTVDFTPTLAEFEAGRAKLRGELYKRVNDALAQLSQAEPDRKYRIKELDISEPGSPNQIVVTAKRRMASAQMESPAPYAAGVTLSQKIQLTADVTFAALAPRE